jgi:hypothetical protein
MLILWEPYHTCKYTVRETQFLNDRTMDGRDNSDLLYDTVYTQTAQRLIMVGCLSIYGSTALFWRWALIYFLDLFTVGRTPWTGDQPGARPLPAHRAAQTQNKRTQTSIPRVRFETVHALDHAATVIGNGRMTDEFERICLEGTVVV